VAVRARRGVAGRGGRPAAARGGAELLGDLLRVQPLERVGQEAALGDRLAADVVLVQRVLDARDDLLRVDDVGGDEGLHLARDLVHGSGRARVAERRREALGDLRDAVAPQVEHEQEVLLGALHVARDVEALGPLVLAVGLDLELVDLRLEVERVRGVVARAQDLEEGLADGVVGLLDEHRDLAVVVLERALLTAREAAADAHHEEDEHEDDRPDRDTAPDQQL
jgi:hypothetical protein